MWRKDFHRFPPYQYQRVNLVINKHGQTRLPSIVEREAALGFPIHYTANCVPKAHQKGEQYQDTRLSLLGNTSSVPIVAWLLAKLGHQLGLIPHFSPTRTNQAARPGGGTHLQTILTRPPLRQFRRGWESGSERDLLRRLIG